ncbi:DNA helicase [Malassezia caprae]|uniref:DNA helicase n=1 Tax=Malassezia caprae TaxID=1381934 RepID=A0AAF0E5P1_9BASI|nr:DNA helicase [Malassezia caprae]
MDERAVDPPPDPPRVHAAQAEAHASPAPPSTPASATPATSASERRRRRLDRELGFSSPGPAFQLSSDAEVVSSPDTSSPAGRSSRRAVRPSRAALQSGMLKMWQVPSSDEPLPPATVLARARALADKLQAADAYMLRQEHAALLLEVQHLSRSITHTPLDAVLAQKSPEETYALFQAQHEQALRLQEPRRRSRRSMSATRSPSPPPEPSRAKRVRVSLGGQKRAASPPAPESMALVPLSSGTDLDAAHPPPLTYLSPAQRPARPMASCFSEWMASQVHWDDEIVTPAVRAQRLAYATHVYVRISELARQGKALGPGVSSTMLKLKPQEAPRTPAHWDYLLAAAAAQAQRTRQLSKARMQLAKKVSRMIAAYWDRELNQDEREQKLEWRRQRALAKWTMKEVQRQWRLAVTVIRGRKQAVERAEREKLGKKQLQAIIEQSTQMLETQHAELASETPDDAADDAADEGDRSQESEDSDESAAESADGVDDEQLERDMWEEDEEDEDEDADLQADADLPLDELLKKYKYDSHSKSPAAKDESDTPSDFASASEALSDADDASEAQSDADDASEAQSDADGASEAESVSLQALLGEEHKDSALPKVRPPFLLRGTLRPYQQMGMEWLFSLYNNQVNGILADEMGLGKTIQTISLLAHLACDHGNWGPHLVVAPTSVMLNWEMEFKKFLPGFKILSYYGSQKQRKAKRVGWNTPNSFHVCITSYQLVLADQHIFRRKPWSYLILDEAHHIKNFRSQRWQTLLGFNSQHRLLLTGTPLQNNLMDLWSLMYFLMPQGIERVAAASGAFTNMKDFQDWFSNPLGKAAENTQGMDDETRETVAKLHTVLRPYVLRRLKSDVEREMPKKFEHIVPCRLSKRQRFLYNDFMSRAKTRESLASGNYMSIINCLMQLRKVCNHPDLFEPRPIVTPFVTRAVAADYEIKDLLVRRRLLADDPWASVNADFLNLQWTQHEPLLTPLATRRYAALDASDAVAQAVPEPGPAPPWDAVSLPAFQRAMEHRRAQAAYDQAQHRAYVNRFRCAVQPVYGRTLIETLREATEPQVHPLDAGASRSRFFTECEALRASVRSYEQRAEAMHSTIVRFAFATPPALAPEVSRLALAPAQADTAWERRNDPLHAAAVSLNVAFPDASLLQYDCGKLQQLDTLMRRLVDEGHRVLIFTQMTKVLDILEKFFNYHGYRYLRLDGATKVEQRQALTERFNRDTRISAFILSTRSGGLGINLVGADTVIFYDLDWNAAIESQCMDRAHRIGQTRDVHIYRFVSEHTIEENMLRKANQKRRLDSMVIQQGEFTTEHLMRNDWRDMLDEGGKSLGGVKVGDDAVGDANDVEKAFRAAEDAEDAAAVHVAHEEHQLDHADFEGDVDAVNHPAPSSPMPTPGALPAAERPVDADSPHSDMLPDDDEDDDDLVGSIDDYMLRHQPLRRATVRPR